ncbi:hypothetical protein CSHISOI_08668, partial [Colletotrichum shisoi]
MLVSAVFSLDKRADIGKALAIDCHNADNEQEFDFNIYAVSTLSSSKNQPPKDASNVNLFWRVTDTVVCRNAKAKALSNTSSLSRACLPQHRVRLPDPVVRGGVGLKQAQDAARHVGGRPKGLWPILPLPRGRAQREVLVSGVDPEFLGRQEKVPRPTIMPLYYPLAEVLRDSLASGTSLDAIYRVID